MCRTITSIVIDRDGDTVHAQIRLLRGAVLSGPALFAIPCASLGQEVHYRPNCSSFRTITITFLEFHLLAILRYPQELCKNLTKT